MRVQRWMNKNALNQRTTQDIRVAFVTVLQSERVLTCMIIRHVPIWYATNARYQSKYRESIWSFFMSIDVWSSMFMRSFSFWPTLGFTKLSYATKSAVPMSMGFWQNTFPVCTFFLLHACYSIEVPKLLVAMKRDGIKELFKSSRLKIALEDSKSTSQGNGTSISEPTTSAALPSMNIVGCSIRGIPKSGRVWKQLKTEK